MNTTPESLVDLARRLVASPLWHASDRRRSEPAPADPPLGSLILSSLEAEDDTELGRTWAATNTEEK